MQSYKNTSPTSCVYDAFQRAGVPTEPYMLNGVTSENVIKILKNNGWKVLLKGDSLTGFKENLIVMRDYKKDFAHLEHHESIATILDYPPDTIGAIAYKENNFTYVFKRGQLYLSERFAWGNEPNAFDEFRQDELQAMFDRMPDPPTHYAVMSGLVMDLDAAEWREI